MDAALAKTALRTEAFALRKKAFAEGQGEAGGLLTAHLAPHAGKVLAGYMAMRTEIDPIAAMEAHDGPVCVPVIVGPGMALRFREWRPGCAMVRGGFGAMIPEDGAWLEPDVLIVPLLAFDRAGYRLGYGGGFYDRTLERLRASRPVSAVGFGFAAQEVAEVPVDRFDQRLDGVMTELGLAGG